MRRGAEKEVQNCINGGDVGQGASVIDFPAPRAPRRTVNTVEFLPMSLDAEHLQRLAELARLRIDPAEESALRASLDRILQLVDTLATVDTAGVEPLASPLEAAQPLRPDEVTESDRRESFQAIAPAVEAGLYLVPRVVE